MDSTPNFSFFGIGVALEESKREHPTVSEDLVRATAVCVEEAGEMLKAALDYTRKGRNYPADLIQLVHETEQCAASCIRLLDERLYLLLDKVKTKQ